VRHVVRSVAIQRPAAAAWGAVADLEQFGQFVVGVARWDPIGRPTGGVGDEYAILLQIGSVAAGAEVTVTEFDPDAHHLAWRSRSGIWHEVVLRVTDAADGAAACRLTMDVRFRLTGLGAIAVELLAAPIVRRNLVATLESLRHLVEHELEP
jgi:hypothetical protein